MMLFILYQINEHIFAHYPNHFGRQLFPFSGLTSIALPEGITALPYGCFASTKLTNIKLPKSLTEILSPANTNSFNIGYIYNTEYRNFQKSANFNYDQSGAFYSCTKLESIDFNGAALTSLGYAIFNECDMLRNVNLSTTKLETIPRYAFYSCDSLRTVTFPATVKTIEYQAFYNDQSLESLKMPAALSSIGDNAFGYCKNQKH